MAAVTVHNAELARANGKLTPYADGVYLHGPNSGERFLPDLLGVYQTVFEYMRYISDCTRPDLAFIVIRLVAPTHALTKIHWALLKAAVLYVQQTHGYGISYL